MSSSVTFADRFGATDLSDGWPGAGRTVERFFPFVDVGITMTLPLDETVSERHAILAHVAWCGVKVAERRAVCAPSGNAWQ